MNVAVIGGSSCSKKDYRIAQKMGQLIALEGWVLICGGSSGIMEAVCKGAKQKGGLTVGILPSYTGEEANRYLDVKIPTGFGYARNTLVIRAADVVIAISGKSGTLSEIAFSLCEEKPILGINTWGIKGVKKIKNPLAAIKAIKKIFKDENR